MAEVSTPAPPGAEQNDGSSKAQEAAGQAKDKAQEVAGQAKDKAQEAAGQAKGRVREQVDQRSTQAGEQVTSTASDLRTVGEELRNQGKETPAKLADQAAQRTEQLGSYLTNSDADTILSDVEDFARRQPWAVVAGGIALGFAASRFMKASSSQRYQSRASGGSGQRPSSIQPSPASIGSARPETSPGVLPPPPPPSAGTTAPPTIAPGSPPPPGPVV